MMHGTSVQAMCSSSAVSALLCNLAGWGSCCQTFSHLATLSLISLHHKDVKGMELIEGEKRKTKGRDSRAGMSLCACVTER